MTRILICSWICFWSLIHGGCLLQHILAEIRMCAWKAELVICYLLLISMTCMGFFDSQHG